MRWKTTPKSWYLVVGLSKILAPGNDDVCLIDSQQDEILSIPNKTRFCRKDGFWIIESTSGETSLSAERSTTDHRPSQTSFNKFLPTFVAAWRLSAVNGMAVSLKSNISEAWNDYSQKNRNSCPSQVTLMRISEFYEWCDDKGYRA